MASATMAATVSDLAPFHFVEEAHLKATSPYGLPVVDHCQNCKLRNSKFFCNLSQPAVKSLDAIKHTTAYPEGALVLMEGQAARGVYLVCHGRVKMYTTNSEGKTLILKIAQAGEIIGMHSVVSGTAHELTVETLQPSQLAYISREDFLRFLKENGDACLQAAQHLSRDCQSAYDVIRSIGLSHSASEKLARLLLQFSADGRVSDGVTRVKLALTHEEMAQLIGSSRETVTRIMSDLKKRQIAELSGSTFVLRNRTSLENIAYQ
ncbi:MAG TPA: Crp/Fnr family transcriptional regulator [Terriglobales bacterium]|nr:Crp/Fnr family transcriptional regulator [Terriglobales bacterium]